MKAVYCLINRLLSNYPLQSRNNRLLRVCARVRQSFILNAFIVKKKKERKENKFVEIKSNWSDQSLKTE